MRMKSPAKVPAKAKGFGMKPLQQTGQFGVTRQKATPAATSSAPRPRANANTAGFAPTQPDGAGVVGIQSKKGGDNIKPSGKPGGKPCPPRDPIKVVGNVSLRGPQPKNTIPGVKAPPASRGKAPTPRRTTRGGY